MTLRVEFVSPEDLLYSGEGIMVTTRTRGGGEIAFLTGHEPFIGSLQTSQVKVTEVDGTVRLFAVRRGFVSVTGEKVTVLSDVAVPVESIDVRRANADLTEANAKLTTDQHDPFALADRKWAELRIELAVG